MRPVPEIRTLGEDDLHRVLALNRASVEATSPLDLPGLRTLLAASCYARAIGAPADAFLIAMDGQSAYESINFRWFKARRERFIYVDRIIVADEARGLGLGRALYADLFAFGQERGYERICCEVNFDPPNPLSDAFHKALGFTEVGRAAIHNGVKTVRYLEKAL